MKQTILTLFSFILILVSRFSFGQEVYIPEPVVCPAGKISSDFYLGPPSTFLAGRSNGRSLTDQFTAEFKVTYKGFSAQPGAQEAFQYAVDIWATLIQSDVPIYLSADFTDLGENVLGSAGPTAYLRNFEGALNDSTYYHIALAEKMARRDLNEPGEADIAARFNSSFSWYYGTDGNPAPFEYDFISTVLHEIGHGLGFSSLDSHDGSVGYNNPGSYNNFIVNGSGVSIYNIPNESTELADYLTSDNLFLNAPHAKAANSGSNAEIYAPSPYNGGSSISHLGESFNDTENACMTFSGAPGEVTQSPGPIVIGLFEDMGWLSATLLHERDWILEGFVDDIVLDLELRTDLALIEGFNLPVLTYSFDNFETSQEVSMSDAGNGQFSYAIPNPGVNAVLSYYFSGIKDEYGRTYTSPSAALSGAEISDPYRMVIQSGTVTDLPFLLADGGDFESDPVFQSFPIEDQINIWEHGEPANVLTIPSSGTKVWKTGLNENLTQPLNNYASALLTPKFDLSDLVGDYNLSFDLYMDNPSGVIGLSVLYTIDGGISWQTLGDVRDKKAVEWYDREVGYLPIIDKAWVFDNSDEASAREVSYSLTELLGANNIQFLLVASVSNQFESIDYVSDGILIDDFELTKTTPKAKFITSLEGGSVFPGTVIDFEFISSGADSFSWFFGGRATSELENPSYAFESNGTYDVSLTITYPGGTDVANKTIVVGNTISSSYSLEKGGNFEVNASDFSVDNISGTAWERGKSTVNGKQGTSSGDFAWVTGLDSENYEDQSEAFLYTPLFDFSFAGEYSISFMANYQTELGWDGFVVEYTLNGTTWSQLAPVVGSQWYDKIGENNVNEGWPAIPLMTGSTNGNFVLKTRDISELAGNSIVGFRFHWKSDFASVDVGVAIDDFILTGPTTVADFTYIGNSGCDGQVVVFSDASTGDITDLNWDFGDFANPQTAQGIGPHSVTYSGGLGMSTVTLTGESISSGTLEKTFTDVISTAPTHVPSLIEEDNGNTSLHKLVASEGDAYQWFLNDVILVDESFQELITSQSGDFSVAVSIDGCSVTTEAISFVLGVGDTVFRQGLYIYPNPTNDVVNVAGLRGGVNFVLYDILGQEIERGYLNQEKSTISLLNVNPGIIIVKLKMTDGDIVVRRISKK